MAWFNRQKPGVDGPSDGGKTVRTEGLWFKCEGCEQIVWKKSLDENLNCCPKCNFHFKIDPRTRLALLLDGAYQEHDSGLASTDPLHFVDKKGAYSRVLEASKKETGLNEAVIAATGTLD